MTFLSLKFLGSLDIALNQVPVAGLRSAKVEALLAYLAVEQERPLRRDALVALLWPDEPLDTARTNLRQSITRLQKGIDNQNANPPFLLISRETVQFNVQSQHTLDATRFQKLLTACPTHGDKPERQCAVCVENLQTAVSLYRADLLPAVSEIRSQRLPAFIPHLHQSEVLPYDRHALDRDGED